MSVRVIIGTSERDLKNIESNWVNEQINRRKEEGAPICIRVLIEHGDINITLSTPDCPCGSGKPRRLTNSENEVLELWNSCHLNENRFSSGNLVSFLKQLRI